MKKFLIAISFVLLITIVSAVPMGAVAGGEKWTPPEGIGIIYATDLSSKEVPSIDGTILPNEYGGIAFVQEEPLKMAKNWPENIYDIDDNSDRPSSGKIEFYFAYDQTSIYIAFKEYGRIFDDNSTEYVDYAMRNNYGIEYGFDLNDITNYFLHVVTYGSSCWDKDLRFSDGKSSNFAHTELMPHDLYSELFVNKYPVSEVEMAESERGVYAYGDVFSASNTNSTEPYILEAEFKIDKDQAISLYNSLAYTNYANMPNAMYFSIGTHVYRAAADGTSASSQGYSRYLSTDVRGKSDNLFDYGVLPGSAADCLPYLIVFGDENTVITIPKDASEVSDTEVASTEAITTLPDQNLESVIETEETENNEEKEAEASVADESTDAEPSTMGSCGGSVSLAGLALISVLSTCTVFVAKKKED